MNKWLLLSIGCAALWSGSAMYAMYEIKQDYATHLKSFAAESTLPLKVVYHRFDSSAFSSTATTEFALQVDPCTQETLKFTLKERFKHDLISGLGAITSELEFVFAKDVEDGLKKLFANKDPMTITGRYQLNGDVLYHIDSPSSRLTNPDANNDGYLTWGGVTGDIRFVDKQLQANMVAKSLDLVKDDSSLGGFSNIKFEMTQQANDAGFSSLFSVDKFELTDNIPHLSNTLRIDNLSMRYELKQQAKLANISHDIRLGELSFGQEGAGKAGFKMAMNRVDLAAFKKFNQELKRLGASCKPNFTEFVDAAKALYTGKPEFKIDDFYVEMGEMRVSLRGHVKGIDFSKIGLNQPARETFGAETDLALTLHANRATIDRIAQSKAEFSPLFNSLNDYGLIKSDNEGYFVRAAVKDEQFTLNDMPLATVMTLLQAQRQAHNPFNAPFGQAALPSFNTDTDEDMNNYGEEESSSEPSASENTF
ncbi:DUF945 family protein [Agitococcus lubricus]|uniref:Uncharacterized protein YdgA (DUF945 family) n=1 Tax=Agitococcus lubricus TaxID=1077255 RepID=A0A2T5J491_9GAMM|nr:DUF945 family protein [Agitococcus lubricus]PTQ91421.1 uncharacterized protein YdgA (DUF945 family) [Agitococcus lubricus]